MALSTSVTPAVVAVAVGQSAPASGSPIEARWQMWIDDALMLIQTRFDSITPAPTTPAQSTLDYVIREAVVAQVLRPDSATQVTTSIDDGSVSKTYRSSAGRLEILGEWWALLGLAQSSGRAFMVDLLPDPTVSRY